MERLLFQSIRYIAIFVLGITSFVSRASDTDTPLLYDLDPNDGVKESRYEVNGTRVGVAPSRVRRGRSNHASYRRAWMAKSRV